MAVGFCKVCGERWERDYGVCWKCGADVDGSPPSADFVAAGEALPVPQRELVCLRCGTDVDFVRRMKLHEGSLLPGLLFDIGQLFTHREHFDTYACPGCGKVEFFMAE